MIRLARALAWIPAIEANEEPQAGRRESDRLNYYRSREPPRTVAESLSPARRTAASIHHTAAPR